MTIIKFGSVPHLDRGGGIATVPLVTPASAADSKIVSGISCYPPSQGAPLHFHNCDEQVTLITGRAEVEVNGESMALAPYDTTYIPAYQVHAFRNIGAEPMQILWVYAATRVTRTFHPSGETVEHLSSADLLGGEVADLSRLW